MMKVFQNEPAVVNSIAAPDVLMDGINDTVQHCKSAT